MSGNPATAKPDQVGHRLSTLLDRAGVRYLDIVTAATPDGDAEGVRAAVHFDTDDNDAATVAAVLHGAGIPVVVRSPTCVVIPSQTRKPRQHERPSTDMPTATTINTPAGDVRLFDFTITGPDDPAKTVLELTHDPCGMVLCDVEPNDTLYSLLRTTQDHVCPNQPHWHVRRHVDDEDTWTTRFTELFSALAYAGLALDAAAVTEAEGAAAEHYAAVATRHADTTRLGDELSHYRAMTENHTQAERYRHLALRLSEVVEQNALPVNDTRRKPLYRANQGALRDAAEDAAALVNGALPADEFHIWQADETCKCNHANT